MELEREAMSLTWCSWARRDRAWRHHGAWPWAWWTPGRVPGSWFDSRVLYTRRCQSSGTATCSSWTHYNNISVPTPVAHIHRVSKK